MKPIFISFLIGLALLAAAPGSAQSADDSFDLQYIRNATIKLNRGSATFFVDPMLADVGAYDGFPDTHRSWLRNPLTSLPMPVKDIREDVDAVILTHRHLDHWDNAVQEALPKSIPIYVQNREDADLMKGHSFTDVRIMKDSDEFVSVKMDRTRTRHGSGAMYAVPELAKLLGDVMGIVFTAPDGKKAWIVGGTVWFDGVDDALAKHRPDVIIMNACAAALTEKPFMDAPEIIMCKEDVKKMPEKMPESDTVAIHLDAINHMTVRP